jgi:peptide subunit release factor 1 (eRF1)
MTSIQFVESLSMVTPSIGHTTLVTMYVPGDYSLDLVNQRVSSEISLQTRTCVIDALQDIHTSIVSSNIHNAPTNGLVICAGDTKQCV